MANSHFIKTKCPHNSRLSLNEPSRDQQKRNSSLKKLFSNKCDNCLLSISLENELSVFVSFHVGRCPVLRSSFRQCCAFIFTRNPPLVQISMTKCVRLVKVRSSDRSLDVGTWLQTFAHLNIQWNCQWNNDRAFSLQDCGRWWMQQHTASAGRSSGRRGNTVRSSSRSTSWPLCRPSARSCRCWKPLEVGHVTSNRYPRSTRN